MAGNAPTAEEMDIRAEAWTTWNNLDNAERKVYAYDFNKYASEYKPQPKDDEDED